MTYLYPSGNVQLQFLRSRLDQATAMSLLSEYKMRTYALRLIPPEILSECFDRSTRTKQGSWHRRYLMCLVRPGIEEKEGLCILQWKSGRPWLEYRESDDAMFCNFCKQFAFQLIHAPCFHWHMTYGKIEGERIACNCQFSHI